jgi:hypothetical protein
LGGDVRLIDQIIFMLPNVTIKSLYANIASIKLPSAWQVQPGGIVTEPLPEAVSNWVDF